MPEHSLGAKFRALLATGRVANLPTVWSNVIVAYFLALTIFPMGFTMQGENIFLKYHSCLLIFACLGCSCLYIGGCMLGDYRDIEFDRKNRPGRPLVTGALSPSRVVTLASLLLILGFIIGGLSTAAAMIIPFNFPSSQINLSDSAQMTNLLQFTPLLLLVCLLIIIVIYALFHKQSRIFALLNMSLCRTQLVVFSAALGMPILHGAIKHSGGNLLDYIHGGWSSPLILIPAFSVGLYTLLLASVAATESNKDKIKFSRLLKTNMFLLPALAILALVFLNSENLPLPYEMKLAPMANSSLQISAYTIGALFIYCGWVIYSFTSLPEDKPSFVSKALAGFCLLDACFAATYSTTIPLICLALFGLSLLLQKVTPAT